MFTNLHIYNTGRSAADIVTISLSVPQTWLLFRHGVLLPATFLLGQESFKALHGTNLNAVYSLLTGTGNTNIVGRLFNKQPKCMLELVTTIILSFAAREMSQLPT